MVAGGLRYWSFERKFQWQNPEQIRAYQFERLKHVLQLANQIPFYKERFRSTGFSPPDLKSLEDLRLLPVLSKQEVRDHFWQMFEPRQSRRAILSQTRGPTGEPLRFLLSREQVWMEWANIWRCWMWVGYRPYD